MAGQSNSISYELAGKRIYVAGHAGMVGSAVVSRLEAENCQILTVPRSRLDLADQSEVRRWFRTEKPDVVVFAAARVGGIVANNSYPANFIYENLIIQSNVIDAAFRHGVNRLLFLGSSCIYPRLAPQPITEDALLTGPLETTNEWYAIAKIAGLKMCAAYRRQHGVDYISAMPTNLYGPGDNFDLNASHVIPALMRKAHEAKAAKAPTMTIWGSGSPRREFLHVHDAADAIVYLLKTYSSDTHINVGSGSDVTILELAQLVCDVVGCESRIEIDTTKPDGTPRKLLDVSRLAALGWRPRYDLRRGLEQTYAWFLEHLEKGDARGMTSDAALG